MPVNQTETTHPWTFDARSAAVYGLVTAAWYTVPDLVERRSTRALLKTVCGVSGIALLLRTGDGREALEGVRRLRDAMREPGHDDALAGTSASVAGATAPCEADSGDVPDNTLHGLTPVEITPAGKAAVATGAVVVLGVTTALAVVGEKVAYRWGERLRARGVRAPHARVGLVLGAAAAVLGGLAPASEAEEDLSVA
ncbi:hypothetical protein [Oerskovia merdavium]|uniref:Peptidase S9 n=1 Tax=Oerskovia merdavium TaxID=2762227 RepID=A0ABR8U152_9CELL|nr:hypothetical protein [Oerskovia merdavium]MBD7981777.1 hypothetical protein [Oerskovia merdavium]